MNGQKQLDNVVLPRQLFSSMMQAQRQWLRFSNEFEDFLLSVDEGFMNKMRKARQEHLKGKARSLQQLKRELL